MPNKLKPKGMVCLTNTHAILKKKSRWDIRLIEYFLEYFFLYSIFIGKYKHTSVRPKLNTSQNMCHIIAYLYPMLSFPKQ